MATRRFDWRKHIRVGGFLLVFVLFAPALWIFFAQTLALFPKHFNASRAQLDESMMVSVDRDISPIGMPGEMAWDAIEPTGMMAKMSTGAPMTDMMAFDASDRKVIKNASLDLRVESLTWTVDRIQEIVKNAGGYVENSDVSQPKSGVRTAWISARVPADRLDAVLDESKKSAASVVSEYLNIGDVTDQDADLSARLNAKQAEETALVSLLNRAEKMTDIIEVTERLSLVRSEIERMQAEQRSLAGHVAMASVSMSITEDPRVAVDADSIRGGNVVKQSISDISRWGIALGSAFVALVITGLPVIAVYGFLIWIFFRVGRFIARRIVR